MTTRTPDDPRIDYLFARYWDDALTVGERAELEYRLGTDPAARAAFNRCLAFAVAAADRPAVTHRPTPPTRRMTRRRVIGYMGAGLAAGAAGLLAVPRRPDPGPALPRAAGAVAAVLTGCQGLVTLAAGDPRAVAPGLRLFAGDRLASHGLESAAELQFPDGTRIGLTADTAVVLTGAAGLVLQSGTATADLPPPPAGRPGFALATAEAVVSTPPGHGAGLAVGRTAAQTTEIGVERGRATITARAAATDLLGGELLTVRGDGVWRKEPLQVGLENYAWDLSGPLPDGWQVGIRELTPDGPVVRSELWYDPYHSTEMYMIRSHKWWTRGLCQVWPDSRVRVRYRVNRPGQSQVVLVVRAVRNRQAGGVLEMNAAFDRADPGRWTTFDAPAAALLANRHAPAGGPPWVLTQTLFNTFEADLGLQVADLRVTRGGRRTAPG